MKLGVDRNGRRTGVPDGVKTGQVVRDILGEDAHAVARDDALIAKALRETRRPAREGGVLRDHLLAVHQRGPVAHHLRGPLQPKRHVHRAPSPR
jgi:hypothetical protein